MLHHATKLLGSSQASEVAAATFEFGAFMIDRLNHPDVGACWHGRVAWHDACHGLRDLGLHAQPRTLLSHVQGLTLVESVSSTQCCGFGGTFSTKLPGISVAMADEKIDELLTLNIDAIASSDFSCLMQLEGRLRQRGSTIRSIHLAELLASRDAPR